MVFVGLVTLQDPPRDEVPQAIRECHSAGVKVVMVTGKYIRVNKYVIINNGINRKISISANNVN